MKLRRWAPFVTAAPGRYADPEAIPEGFDFEAWADEFEWTQDPWNGWLDVAATVPETIETERGDCEDYALVAVSWGLVRDRSGLGMAFCFPPRSPVARHVIAYDDERVYSSGRIVEKTPSEWLEDSRYVRMLRRSVG